MSNSCIRKEKSQNNNLSSHFQETKENKLNPKNENNNNNKIKIESRKTI